MKIVHLIQGTPEWHAHRQQYFNASDTPVMLGISPYKTRAQLIEDRVTGLIPEIDDFTQRILDQGHAFERLIRPVAEKMIGEELFPCVAIEGKYSASFDGLTMAEDLVFEHKTLNKTLRACFAQSSQSQKDTTGECLPEHYRAQLEHQLLVSGAPHALFMASSWDNNALVEEKHCWYNPNPALRARIIAGWEQFEADCAAYKAREKPIAVVVATAPADAPVLNIEVTGAVLSSNFAAFKDKAMESLRSINRDMKTDADFIHAEQSVKSCKSVEDRIVFAKECALSKMVDVFVLFKSLDEVKEEARCIRLDLERRIKTEKEARRSEIVAEGVQAVRDHYALINATLGIHALALPAGMQAIIGAAIKGKKTIDSIQDAAQQAVANLKIDASQKAEKVRANIALLDEHQSHAHLFTDRVSLCSTKEPDDLRNLIAMRINAHRQAEQERLNAERVRIRQEELQRIERDKASVQPPSPPVSIVASTPVNTASHAQSRPDQFITLKGINDLIKPLKINTEQLALLGVVYSDHQSKKYSYKNLGSLAKALREIASSLEQLISQEAA